MITPDSLEIAVSAMYREDLSFLAGIFPGNLLQTLNILVINQTDDTRRLTSPRENIRVINSSERGLAKSRNMAIKNCMCRYAILTDDDVIFEEDLLIKLNKGFMVFPEAAIIKFQAMKFGNTPFSDYAPDPITNLGLFGLMGTSSIEMVIDMDKLKDNNILFDENFGLGAVFGNGLEQAFLDNVRKRKLQVAYYPRVIVSHPHDCSGRNHTDHKYYYVNGALAQKMFGSLSLFWAFVFLLFQIKHKNIPVTRARHFFRIYRDGGRHYKKLTQ